MNESTNRIYIPINKRPTEDRPREKLWAHGAEALSSTELIAILVRKGSKHRSALQVADDLLATTDAGLHGLAAKHPKELCQIKGIGEANGAQILAALEIARRLSLPRQEAAHVHLETVEDVAAYYRRRYDSGSPEKFVAFFINRQHRLLGELLVSRGGSNATVVDPKRVYREALLYDAKAVILAHNHPGGSTVASDEDVKLTRRLVAAGGHVSIPIVEHVVITEGAQAGMIETLG